LLTFAALLGASTLPLAIAGFSLYDTNAWTTVNPGSSDSELVNALLDTRRQRTWAIPCLALAAATLWTFLGPLWARVRQGAEWLAVVAIVGGAIYGAMLLFWSGMALVGMVATDYQDAQAARVLTIVEWEMARISLAPALVMVGATVIAGLRYGVFARWVNVFGAIFFCLLLLGLVPASPAGLMGLASTLWVMILGLVLAFTPRRHSVV
jgi:hypothetical protein